MLPRAQTWRESIWLAEGVGWGPGTAAEGGERGQRNTGGLSIPGATRILLSWDVGLGSGQSCVAVAATGPALLITLLVAGASDWVWPLVLSLLEDCLASKLGYMQRVGDGRGNSDVATFSRKEGPGPGCRRPGPRPRASNQE